MADMVVVLAGYDVDGKIIAHAYGSKEDAQAKKNRLRAKAKAAGKQPPILRVVTREVL